MSVSRFATGSWWADSLSLLHAFNNFCSWKQSVSRGSRGDSSRKVVCRGESGNAPVCARGPIMDPVLDVCVRGPIMEGLEWTRVGPSPHGVTGPRARRGRPFRGKHTARSINRLGVPDLQSHLEPLPGLAWDGLYTHKVT